MKLFREWWKNKTEPSFGTPSVCPGQEESWRTALETVLKEIDGHSYEYSIHELKKFIQKELEEK